MNENENVTNSLPEPSTRLQTYLSSMAGMDVELPQPKTKVDSYMKEIAENWGDSGGGLPAVTEDDDGSVLTVVDGEWCASFPDYPAASFQGVVIAIPKADLLSVIRGTANYTVVESENISVDNANTCVANIASGDFPYKVTSLGADLFYLAVELRVKRVNMISVKVQLLLTRISEANQTFDIASDGHINVNVISP